MQTGKAPPSLQVVAAPAEPDLALKRMPEDVLSDSGCALVIHWFGGAGWVFDLDEVANAYAS